MTCITRLRKEILSLSCMSRTHNNAKNSTEMGNVNSELWAATYQAIKEKHDHAYLVIQEAITLEEQERPHEAIEKYKEGIKLIDEALNIQVQCPDTPDVTWEKACKMIQKVKRTRAEVLTRINCIQSAPEFQNLNSDQPPSYEEAISMSSSSDGGQHPVTYKDLATALNELSIDPNQSMHEEVVYIHEGVRLYFISPNGEVVSTHEPQTLRISLVEGNEPNAPRAILQIGDWMYPLVPGVSPCYRTDYGAFILPNVYSDIPGASVGIILPSDADADVFDLLENILHGIITQETEQEIFEEKQRRVQTGEDIGTKISNKIMDGALFLSNNLILGAEKAGTLIEKSTPQIINKMARQDSASRVNPKVSKGIQMAENVTSKTAKVTGFVAGKVGVATVKLGRFLAPHIQKQGTKLLTSGFRMSEEEASEKVKDVLTVAAGAVEGFTTVYRGLETSAGILGTSLKDNTVKIVEHKYGNEAADVTESGLNTVGNTYNIYQHAKFIRPKSLAKAAGKGLVTGCKTSKDPNLEPGPSNTQIKLKTEQTKQINEKTKASLKENNETEEDRRMSVDESDKENESDRTHLNGEMSIEERPPFDLIEVEQDSEGTSSDTRMAPPLKPPRSFDKSESIKKR